MIVVKKIVMILCMVMLCIPTIIKADYIDPNDLLVEDNEVHYTEEYEMKSKDGGITNYAFIYKIEGRQWYIENIIGPTDCKEGYLYLKNLKTGKIIQLVSEPVNVFVSDEADKGVYFVYKDNIFYVDYSGQNIKNIYCSTQSIEEGVLECIKDELYFCEDGKIVKLNLKKREKSILADGSNITMLWVKSYHEIVYSDDGYNTLNYVDYDNKIHTVATTQVEMNVLFEGESSYVRTKIEHFSSCTSQDNCWCIAVKSSKLTIGFTVIDLR